MPARRSPTWRIIPWMLPFTLILVGLMLVSGGLSGSPDKKAASTARSPANVTATVTAAAPGWASGQVGSDVDTTVQRVIMVDARATGSATYTTRAVVVRQDAQAVAAQPSPVTLGDADHSTVATCVVFDVNVSLGTAVAAAAGEVRREVGVHAFDDSDALVEQCAAVTFSP